MATAVGGAIAIACLALATSQANLSFIMAHFGASCVLLFSVPASPLSQPENVIGGHLQSTFVGLVLTAVLPNVWWAVALAAGLAIALMAALRVTHPPAGANPLVIFAADPGFLFLLFPVLSVAVALVAIATIYHRLSGTTFPLDPS
ncbi:HPP family protein [Shimia abyssi]|uniref:HPP family protein n=2 Tax=Shimia abyssi TaxID=1662395 RepID=A0A2P8FER5_9RHOB|nr:HPP family protein [Shimia abyssi]PSL20216.1 HPP family protein [Shimia abyssi]